MKEPVINVKTNVQQITIRVRVHPARLWWQCVRISLGAMIVGLGARVAGTRLDLDVEQQVQEEPAR